MATIAFLTLLVGANVAVKLYSLWKIAGINVDDLTKKEIETLVKQEFMFDQLPKSYWKYMR